MVSVKKKGRLLKKSLNDMAKSLLYLHKFGVSPLYHVIFYGGFYFSKIKTGIFKYFDIKNFLIED